MRVGVLGGSFDPPHQAHLFAACYAVTSGRVDRVLLVPVFRHPLDKPLSPYEHRVAMCRRLLATLGERFEVSEIERALGGVSYTVRTLERLATDHPEDELCLIIGTDALAERDEWKDFERIRELAELVVMRRRGAAEAPEGEDALPVVLPELSSTEIRERLGRGESIAGLVPAAVADYIEENGLYR